MQLSNPELVSIIETTASTVATKLIQSLEDRGMIAKKQPETKKIMSAYQKTEALLFSYPSFKRIVEERMQEIEEIRRFGVPQKCGAVGERVQGGLVHGIVLPEESVENAVRTVQDSVQDTVRVIALIDKCMAALRFDPYYKILEMRYFEGRTQEDIAVYFGCNQATIARNKSRLVKELAMRIFPDQVANEIMN